MAFYGVAKRIVQVALWPFYKVEAEYRAELPQDKGYIMASNHVSDMDPVMLGLAFHKQLRFMAKEELFKIPVLGGIIRALGAFPVARGKGDQTAIRMRSRLWKTAVCWAFFLKARALRTESCIV